MMKGLLTKNKYTIVEPLSATTTYSTVYLVANQDGDLFADKVASEYDHVMYLEVDIMRRLQHPNLMPALDLFFDDNLLLNIIMPLATQGTIDEALPSADFDTRVRWCYEVASAVHFLHINSIYHCDLKPQNVVIIDGHAVLIDFGLSGDMNDTKHGGQLNVCGTMSYYGPETFDKRKIDSMIMESVFSGLGDEATDAISRVSDNYKKFQSYVLADIFGLGNLFSFILGTNYNVLQGKLTGVDSLTKDQDFSNMSKTMKSFSNLLTIDVTQSYPFVSDVNAEWKKLLAQMVAFDPMQRPSSIQDVLNNPVFASRSYNKPVPGRLMDLVEAVAVKNRSAYKSIVLTLLDRIIENAEVQRSEDEDEFDDDDDDEDDHVGYIKPFTLYIFIDLLQRYMTSDQQASVLACFAIAANMTGEDELSYQDLFSVDEDLMKQRLLLEEKIVKASKGRLRHLYVYDLAVSLAEVEYGLLELMLGNRTEAQGMHFKYVNEVETPEERENRVPKNALQRRYLRDLYSRLYVMFRDQYEAPPPKPPKPQAAVLTTDEPAQRRTTRSKVVEEEKEQAEREAAQRKAEKREAAQRKAEKREADRLEAMQRGTDKLEAQKKFWKFSPPPGWAAAVLSRKKEKKMQEEAVKKKQQEAIKKEQEALLLKKVQKKRRRTEEELREASKQKLLKLDAERARLDALAAKIKSDMEQAAQAQAEARAQAEAEAQAQAVARAFAAAQAAQPKTKAQTLDELAQAAAGKIFAVKQAQLQAQRKAESEQPLDLEPSRKKRVKRMSCPEYKDESSCESNSLCTWTDNTCKELSSLALQQELRQQPLVNQPLPTSNLNLPSRDLTPGELFG